MKTIVYVDGFNLYYGCLKGTAHKWLDLAQLCRHVLPRNEVTRIKYFSAKLSARPGDPGLPNRQELYFRALRTLPSVEIILGRFLESDVRMVESSSPPASRALSRSARPRRRAPT